MLYNPKANAPQLARANTAAITPAGFLKQSFAALALTAATLACAVSLANPAAAEMTDAGKQAMEKAGEIMFEHRCKSCHSGDPEAHSYGPTLVGVVGRKAGSIEGFNYSDALKNSGLVWNENSLRAWMADNTGVMPGTRMRHVGIDDRAEQDFILAYLKTLTAK